MAKEAKKNGRPVEWTPQKLKVLSEALLNHVKLPGVWHISDFEINIHDMEPGWLYHIGTRHERFRPVLKKARYILGQKLLKKAMEGGGDKWIIKTLTPLYLKDLDIELIEREDAIEDKKLERQMKLEKFKHDIGQKSDEDAKAKIDQFDLSVQLMHKVHLLEKQLKSKGIKPDDSQVSS